MSNLFWNTLKQYKYFLYSFKIIDMKFVKLLIICLVSSTSFAQYDVTTVGNSDMAMNTTGLWIVTNDTTEDIEGSVYLYDNWKSYAVITTQEDKNIIIRNLNYDTKNGNFAVKVTHDSVYVFNNAGLKEVRLNSKKFKEYTLKGKKCFLEVIAFNSDYTILKCYNKVIRKGKLNPLDQVKEKDRYVIKETIYFKKGNSIKEIKLNKKTLTKLFGKDAKALRDYINDNNLNVKDEKRLQTILNFQNTL